MPHFIKNFSDKEQSKEEVLIDIPAGKRYLDNPMRAETQLSQKGGTCWYYSFNYLRPRYGKSFDDIHHPQRVVEKSLSRYRKKISELDEQDSQFASFMKQFFPNKKITISQVLEFNSKYNLHQLKIFHKIAILMEQFTKQTTSLYLEDYFKMKNFKERIDNSKKVLMSLGVNPDEAFADCLKEKHQKIHELTLENIFCIYYQIVKREAIRAYQLKYSTWNPRDGIDGLLKSLRQDGQLWVTGFIGKPFYKIPAHFLTERVTYKKIYGWNPGAYSCDNMTSTHAIVIVGAQKIKDKESVYYIDPNDPNDAIEGPNIYKMSYERLCTKINAIYDNAITSSGISNLAAVTGPFAVQSNPDDPNANYVSECINYSGKKKLKEKLEAFPALSAAFHALPKELLISSQQKSFDQLERYNSAYKKLHANGIEDSTEVTTTEFNQSLQRVGFFAVPLPKQAESKHEAEQKNEIGAQSPKAAECKQEIDVQLPKSMEASITTEAQLPQATEANKEAKAQSPKAKRSKVDVPQIEEESSQKSRFQRCSMM